MTTHFIEFEISLESLSVPDIEDIIRSEGEPLRWAITKIDREQNQGIVEAVVTKEN